MKRYFCTYFDINFSPRGMALYDSLQANCEDFTMMVMALDDETEKLLAGRPGIIVIPRQEYFTRYNVDETKYATKKELYFSLTAGFCLYVMEKYSHIDILFYLDADIYFFDSVEYLFEEMGNASIFLTAHNVTPLLERIMGYYGSFNVGINGFRNDETGIACLKQWKEDCDSWNSNSEKDKGTFFNDQLYLDQWPAKYPAAHICISKNPGINLAPWSIAQYCVRYSDGHFCINGKTVVAFHFSDLKRLDKNVWDTNSGPHLFYMGFNKRKLYATYLQQVEKHQNKIATKKYVSLNHGRSSLKSRIRTMLNNLTRSVVKI